MHYTSLLQSPAKGWRFLRERCVHQPYGGCTMGISTIKFSVLLPALFLLLLGSGSSQVARAQNPIGCNETVMLDIDSTVITLSFSERMCITFTYTMVPADTCGVPFCCHPEVDPLCPPQGVGCPANLCCCENTITTGIAGCDGITWRGCEPQTIQCEVCVEPGVYNFVIDVSLIYYCESFLTIDTKCPGTCCP